MNIKLLKKVRKKYSIVFFPKGTPVYGMGIYKEDLYASLVNDNVLNFTDSEPKAIDLILKDVRSIYGSYIDRKYNTKGKKIWYKKSK